MLVSLSIRNIVLIEKLDLEFRSGFCALTGETGAGKSILLDALALALGMRAEAGLVRHGAEQASVSAEFQVAGDHPVLGKLADQGLEGDDTLVLRRVLGADGRSRAFINDQPVSVALLKEVGAQLVEIHGQFETQGLLDPSTHRQILDDYAGVDGGVLAVLWQSWRQAEKDLQEAQVRAQKAQAEENWLRGAVDELEDLAPEQGEEEKLAALKEVLKRRDQVLEGFSLAQESLSLAESQINKAWKGLEKGGAETQSLRDTLDRLGIEVQELGHEIQSRFTDLQDCEQSLSEIDDRLFALRGAARKHGCGTDDLPALLQDLKSQILLIERQGEVLDDYRALVGAARRKYMEEAEKVTQRRSKAAEKLDKLVAHELPPLKLDKARFVSEVTVLEESDWGPAGRDRVRFMVATNPGAAPGPLNKIASGGEMSRFMLALKVVMAEGERPGTYIFDEVDTGIGGSTAAAVGERLAALAQKHQILVVTHSPQVAARAQHHWIVMKDGQKNVTTKVVPLAAAGQRQEEIARMISGAEITPEARAAANSLLKTGT